MWRSPSSRRLLRAFLPGAATPAAHRVAEHPIRRPLLFPLFLSSSAVPPPSASPGSGASAVDGPDGAAAEPISFAEAKRLVNVESLKRKLGKDGDEVIGYGELLDACEGMGVARSREEAAAFARVLDDAGVVLLFRDKVYLHPDKVVNLVRKAVPLALAPENDPGREELKQLQKKKEEIDMLAHRSSGARMELGVVCCRNYATSSSNTVSWPLSDSRNVKDIRPQTKPSEYKKSGDGEHLNGDGILEKPIGKNISSVEKRKFLVNTLLDLKESKEAVYGTLNAWVAWEHEFPLASLKKALLVLEKHEQWHRIVQVIKWMLSKGQGKTMGTYEQLIRALEKDNRVEEAHRIWMNKINYDLHSVPWRFCDLMISIYYRNNMLERLLELFQKLESFDRKPPSKRIVQKVGDVYEVLGLLEEKNKLMEKYRDLFSEPSDVRSKKSRKWKKSSAKNGNKAGKKTCKDTEASACMEEESGMSDAEANIAL